MIVDEHEVACSKQYNILRVPTDAIGGLSPVPISNRWWFLEKPLFVFIGSRTDEFIIDDCHPNTRRHIRRDTALNELMNALISFLPSSLGEGQSGCLEEHHLGQW